MASRCQENKSVLRLVSSVTACYSDSRKPIQWRWIKSGERTQVASLRQGHKWGLLCTCAPLKGHFRAMTETYSRLWVPRESRSVLTGLRSKISNAKYTNEFRTDNYKQRRAKWSSRSDWPSRTNILQKSHQTWLPSASYGHKSVYCGQFNKWADFLNLLKKNLIYLNRTIFELPHMICGPFSGQWNSGSTLTEIQREPHGLFKPF